VILDTISLSAYSGMAFSLKPRLVRSETPSHARLPPRSRPGMPTCTSGSASRPRRWRRRRKTGVQPRPRRKMASSPFLGTSRLFFARRSLVVALVDPQVQASAAWRRPGFTSFRHAPGLQSVKELSIPQVDPDRRPWRPGYGCGGLAVPVLLGQASRQALRSPSAAFVHDQDVHPGDIRLRWLREDPDRARRRGRFKAGTSALVRGISSSTGRFARLESIGSQLKHLGGSLPLGARAARGGGNRGLQLRPPTKFAAFHEGHSGLEVGNSRNL